MWIAGCVILGAIFFGLILIAIHKAADFMEDSFRWGSGTNGRDYN